MNGLNEAIRVTGGQAKLARAMGISTQTVHNWLSRGNVPAERCIDIERATGGAVTCEELRPDLAERWAYLRGTEKKVA